MKFLLLKALLLRKSKDEGFTLPMVIAIGMVMVLLSAVNLVQSGEENLMAISQEGSSDALAMAELGVSRYRDLLINNRILAINNLDRWTTDDFVAGDNSVSPPIWSQLCTADVDIWADTTNWRPITLDESISGVDFNSDGDTNDVVSPGDYRIVQYEYDRDGNSGDNNRDGFLDDTTPENNVFSQLADNGDENDDGDYNLDAAGNPNPIEGDNPYDANINNHNDIDNDGESDAVGILTVQGRDAIGSIAQIQVQIPLGVNTQDLDDLDPALWIQTNNITLGNVNANGSNIVLRRPEGYGNCDDPSDLSGAGGVNQNTISDPRRLPPLVTVPNPTGLTKTNDLYSPISDSQNAPRYDASTNTIILGRLSDVQNTSQGTHIGDDRYYFEVSGNLDLTNGQNIISDGTANVIIYVSGNLTINGDVNITNSSDAATSQYLEIHVGGNITIRGTGEVNIKGLVHAPNGTVTMTGTGDVNITGSIFADDWNNTRNGTVSITTDDYRFYSITPNRTPAPLTFRPSDWERQEATN